VQQIRDAMQHFIERRRNLVEARFAGRKRPTEFAHVALQRFDVFSGGFRLADLLGLFVAHLTIGLDFDLQRLSLRFQRGKDLTIEMETAAGQIGRDRIDVLSQELKIQHGVIDSK
jgi:hypothetical protein